MKVHKNVRLDIELVNKISKLDPSNFSNALTIHCNLANSNNSTILENYLKLKHDLENVLVENKLILGK